MSEHVQSFPYQLSRVAFSARDAARAGDVWRAFQDVAVEAAARAGWPPRRFASIGSTWIVRSMTVVHHRETFFGERVVGRSWVRRMRRETFCSREVRLEGETGPIASGSQEWVHMRIDDGPARMPADMIADLGLHEAGGIELPTSTPAEGLTTDFGFRTWHTWMDPLGHVNHPAYVDYCDESTSRRLAEAGLDPLVLVPVAESVTFRSAVLADESVRVVTRAVGLTHEGAIVLSHRIGTEREPRAAEATSIRDVPPEHRARFLAAFGLGGGA